jgi:hypothetical protein
MPDWRLRAIIQSRDGRGGSSSVPVRLGPRCRSKAAKAALLLASPGEAADPPETGQAIDGNEESVQATRLPLHEQEPKVLFRWVT